MSNFRANPHEAYKEFKTLTAKLASCLSVEDVQKTSTILKVKTELVNINSRILTEATISVVDQICKSIDLDMKLKQLHEMEEESVEQAWRPETNKCDILSIEGHHLRKQVKMLKKNLEQVSLESAGLQAAITDWRSQIEEQQEELKKTVSSWQNKDKKNNIVTN
ncbi:uncharacterized protein LOC123676217 isoform X3 [Harmonia axyridis]|uniref:uncharacterized protein LOC123676217 isoform X3 n=1 Tax=Harmonia axyridis TaxID=115357 RepID=UPI001E277809|nr:uncharacterized protein LOC123676217 isoform X3 [Harmonia axyridis]